MFKKEKKINTVADVETAEYYCKKEVSSFSCFILFIQFILS